MDIRLGTTFTLFQPGRPATGETHFLLHWLDVNTQQQRVCIVQNIGEDIGPLLFSVTETAPADPFDGEVQLYDAQWVLTVYAQDTGTNLNPANAGRKVWSELVGVCSPSELPPRPPYDPCFGCGESPCVDPLTWELRDTEGNLLEDGNVTDPCGAELQVTAPDGTVTRDGQPFGSVLSGGTLDVPSECEPCPIEVEVRNTEGDLVDSASIPDACEQEGPVVLEAPDGAITWDGITFTKVVSGGTIDIDCDTPIPAAYVLDGGSKTGTYKVDGAVNGKPRYRLDANHTLEYSGTRWECIHPGADDQAALGDEAFPWDADWSGTSITVTQATIGQYCDDCEPQEPCPLAISINDTEVLTVDDPCVEPTVNIEVVNEDDTQVGSLVGGQWVVPTAKSLCTLITEAETTEEITDCIRSAGKRSEVQCNLMGTAEVANAVTEFNCFPSDVRAAILASECTPSVFDTLRVQFQPYANEARYDFTAVDAGTYDTPTNDGSSGTITYSINGGAFAAWPGATAFVNGDYIVIRRTTATALGWVQIEQ